MPIYQQGSLNLSGQLAPGLYVQNVQPPAVVKGVATNGYGLVGVASWGPVNAPTLVGSPQQAQLTLGSVTNRLRDLATAVAVAFQMGQYNNVTVRVTDGTDVAASGSLKDASTVTGIILTGFYTGVVGNSIVGTIAAGTKPSTFKLTVSLPGLLSETFDNLVTWAAMISAVNAGQSGVRGPSQLVVATAGTSSASIAAGTVTLSGGTDGATGVTDQALVGSNAAVPASGMFALQSAGVLTMNLVDHTTTTQWATMAAFGQQFGIFGAGQGSAGQSIATVAAALATAGVDNYSFKMLTGDWIVWQDTVNSVQRTLSPATFWAPLRASLVPNQSTLNKPVNAMVGTLRSAMNQAYSQPELLSALQGRVDYLANPSAGGSYFGFQTDMNTSSAAATNSEAYTTMTNFLCLSLAANFGYVVGNPQTADLRREVNDAITSWLHSLWTQGLIGNVNAPSQVPFSVQTDANNNPNNMVATGVMQTLVRVTYLSIVRVFAISMQGGATVQVTVQGG